MLLKQRPDFEETWTAGSLMGRLSTPDEFRGESINEPLPESWCCDPDGEWQGHGESCQQQLAAVSSAPRPLDPLSPAPGTYDR